MSKMICWEGPCDFGIPICCYDCDKKDDCPDACDRADECRKE